MCECECVDVDLDIELFHKIPQRFWNGSGIQNVCRFCIRFLILPLAVCHCYIKFDHFYLHILWARAVATILQICKWHSSP